MGVSKGKKKKAKAIFLRISRPDSQNVGQLASG